MSNLQIRKISQQLAKNRYIKSSSSTTQSLQHNWFTPNQLRNAYIAKVVLNKAFDIIFDAKLCIKNTLAGAIYLSY